MRQYKDLVREGICFSWKDALITLVLLTLTTVICMPIRLMEEGYACVAMLYLLMVVIISRITNGYLYGIVASIVSVVGINYVFTAPYFAFSFDMATYPLTFMCMLIVTLIISTLTTKIAVVERKRYLIQAERLRANLLRAVSHDLRTPLTSISSAASIIISRPEMQEAQRNQLLQDIVDDTEWLMRMVENLLSITRISAQPTHLQKRVEAAEEVVGEAVRKFRKRFPDMNISVHLPENVLMVPMDSMLIEQVITNLLQNVVYHGEHATEIHLSLIRDKKGVAFEVRDNGAGIDPQKLPTLFNDFSKSEHSTDAKRGMGIGLSVCRTIVVAHGGEISASNLPEGGACLRFWLPVEEEER